MPRKRLFEGKMKMLAFIICVRRLIPTICMCLMSKKESNNQPKPVAVSPGLNLIHIYVYGFLLTTVRDTLIYLLDLPCRRLLCSHNRPHHKTILPFLA